MCVPLICIRITSALVTRTLSHETEIVETTRLVVSCR